MEGVLHRQQRRVARPVAGDLAKQGGERGRDRPRLALDLAAPALAARRDQDRGPSPLSCRSRTSMRKSWRGAPPVDRRKLDEGTVVAVGLVGGGDQGVDRLVREDDVARALATGRRASPTSQAARLLMRGSSRVARFSAAFEARAVRSAESRLRPSW